MKTAQLITTIKGQRVRGDWGKGVKLYALEIVEETGLDEFPDNPAEFKKILLNGAKDWEQYSYGACSLWYDEDIAQRLCTDRALKANKNGQKSPSKGKTWLDVQTSALDSACKLVITCAVEILAKA